MSAPTHRTRQPAGRPTGGQFAEAARPPAPISLHAGRGTSDLLPGDYEVDDSFPYPQANDLDKIACTVDAVDAGANTHEAIAESLGVHDREGAYYADAAGYLGLLEPVPGEEVRTYSCTSLGQQMTLADNEDRARLMAGMLDHVPAVAIYDEGGEEAVTDLYNLDGLSETTATRRAATIRSWVGQINDPRHLAGSVRTCRMQTINRAGPAALQAQEAARRRSEQRARAEQPPAICPECFMQIPSSGMCDCGHEVPAAA
ncbi:hypothetical protein GCG21_09065 [Pseudactinotalea sp. HY160]|uniref:DUF7226 domain-containing protein n=1 Tax=Pseudactinotalea sp. HY160 TaxID=2654490 RepID=UPI00128E3201|nr:hypothetical protein [Pseudactinotalea sp. HY160]MPV50152.1 hypothetical protein [Pseudactinotalea sp. HY160]